MAEFALTWETLPHDRRQAGSDYLDALNKHGMMPEALSWAQDNEQRFHLLLVTSLVDRLGPSAIYDVLFRAYEKAVTPRSIDPWLVTLFSPETSFGNEFLSSPMMDMDVRTEFVDAAGIQDAIRHELKIGPFRLRSDWIYVRHTRKRNAEHQLRDWHRFVKNVDQIAA